tara:strand:+ start:370 stop:501 length:132 start_codon:yes stop_codon:yes gene_type:complete
MDTKKSNYSDTQGKHPIPHAEKLTEQEKRDIKNRNNKASKEEE